MKKLAVLFFALLFLLCGCGTDSIMTDTAKKYGITEENYPKIDGSTSTLPIVKRIYSVMYDENADGYHDAFPETASKTVPSYYKLIDGEVDLIIVPSASNDVLTAAKQKGVELEFHKIAAEALIFITPKDNSTENITRNQIRDIYLNYGIKNWRELGGPDKTLVPICRNSDSGSQSQLNNFILNNEPIHPEIENNFVALTMEDILYQVADYHTGGKDDTPTNSFALGYTLYAYLKNTDRITGIGNDLKILSYEGVAPTDQTVADGSYPLTDGYYAVIRNDIKEDHPTHAIIKWLKSENGAAAITDLGMFPAK